ncbi:DJ-1 family protein [Histomonas meleagridis]|uniref:DJ-1 family protein n=1 Tax=Histomonas meleagridis TaxID=135588 RepID=UPI0035598185|nr:DJ-1 family protein [Histomonas meleagridis]KAH0806749.1 DJ-1 family protein [Histomonas meleagridis]
MKAVILIAPGFEEVEAITPIDFLRRAGIEVTLASVGHNDLSIKGAHGIVLKCDAKLDDIAKNIYDAIICPGGMPGTKNLAKNAKVVEAIQAHLAAGKVVAAICAAPGYVLAEACGIMKGKTGCGYPGCDDKITEFGGTKVEDRVYVDGNIITSRGPGTATIFALEILRKLVGNEKADEIGKGTLTL